MERKIKSNLINGLMEKYEIHIDWISFDLDEEKFEKDFYNAINYENSQKGTKSLKKEIEEIEEREFLKILSGRGFNEYAERKFRIQEEKEEIKASKIGIFFLFLKTILLISLYTFFYLGWNYILVKNFSLPELSFSTLLAIVFFNYCFSQPILKNIIRKEFSAYQIKKHPMIIFSFDFLSNIIRIVLLFSIIPTILWNHGGIVNFIENLIKIDMPNFTYWEMSIILLAVRSLIPFIDCNINKRITEGIRLLKSQTETQFLTVSEFEKYQEHAKHNKKNVLDSIKKSKNEELEKYYWKHSFGDITHNIKMSRHDTNKKTDS